MTDIEIAEALLAQEKRIRAAQAETIIAQGNELASLRTKVAAADAMALAVEAAALVNRIRETDVCGNFEMHHSSACDAIRAHVAERLAETEEKLERSGMIVSRIWVKLGNPTYEELAGRTIYDLIDELLRARTAADAMAEKAIIYMCMPTEENFVEMRDSVVTYEALSPATERLPKDTAEHKEIPVSLADAKSA